MYMRAYTLYHHGKAVTTVLAIGMGDAVATLCGMGYGHASAATGYTLRAR